MGKLGSVLLPFYVKWRFSAFLSGYRILEGPLWGQLKLATSELHGFWILPGKLDCFRFPTQVFLFQKYCGQFQLYVFTDSPISVDCWCLFSEVFAPLAFNFPVVRTEPRRTLSVIILKYIMVKGGNHRWRPVDAWKSRWRRWEFLRLPPRIQRIPNSHRPKPTQYCSSRMSFICATFTARRNWELRYRAMLFGGTQNYLIV